MASCRLGLVRRDELQLPPARYQHASQGFSRDRGPALATQSRRPESGGSLRMRTVQSQAKLRGGLVCQLLLAGRHSLNSNASVFVVVAGFSEGLNISFIPSIAASAIARIWEGVPTNVVL